MTCGQPHASGLIGWKELSLPFLAASIAIFLGEFHTFLRSLDFQIRFTMFFVVGLAIAVGVYFILRLKR